MTREAATRRRRLRPGARGIAPLALSLAASATPGAPPIAPPLREARTAPMVPDEADHAAADLAVAALAGDARQVTLAAARIDAFDAARDEGPTGLAPAAAELWNAAEASSRDDWRLATQELLSRDDLDPALRKRIERAMDDDPLVRARGSENDARRNAFARFFNAIVEPVGQSVLSISLAPYRLGRSLVLYGVHLYRRDPLPLERRQALAHWKEFLARYPDAEASERVSERVEDAQQSWHRTLREHAMEGAQAALDGGQPREALLLAERALHHSPEYGPAEELRERATLELALQRRARARSVEFEAPPDVPLLDASTRTRAVALLAGGSPAGEDAEDAPSPLRFSRASRLGQEGHEVEAHDLLEEIADGDPERDPMVRHARSALADPVRNPWDTFERARWRDRRKRALWLFIGPFAESEAPDEADEALVTLVEIPRIAQVIITLPLRLLDLPWASPMRSSKVTAVQARRYLRLHPHGAHADDAMDWLERFERERDNPLAALEIAEQRDPPGRRSWRQAETRSHSWATATASLAYSSSPCGEI
jgi:hypothetical protein